MPKLYEIAIAGCNFGADRFYAEEGDILAIHEHPWHWGAMEIGPKASPFLIVPVEFPDDVDPIQYKMPYWEDGTMWQGIISLPSPLATVAKKRYRIPIETILTPGWLKSLSINRVRDPNDVYQPFLDHLVNPVPSIIVSTLEHVAIIEDKYSSDLNGEPSFKYCARRAV